MEPDDLSVLSPTLYDWLTVTSEHFDGASALCVSLLQLWLKGRVPENLVRVVKLIEESSTTYEQGHLGTADPEQVHKHLAILEKWLEHRRWLDVQITQALAGEPESAEAMRLLENFRLRTIAVTGEVLAERLRIGSANRVTVSRPFTLRAPHGTEGV